MVTRQLSSLPVGTPLPEQTLQELKNLGIDNPNKYMSISVMAPSNTIVGALQQTAVSQAEARDISAPLFSVGQGIKRQQEAINAASSDYFKDEAMKRIADIKSITRLKEVDKPLNRNQKANLSVKLSDGLKKDTKTMDTLFEFWQNIQDMSDPNTAKQTVRVDGDKVFKVDSEHSFQNVRDIGLLYSFIKMLDPDSVVREGEIKISDSAKGALQSLGIGINKIFTGETLDKRQRAGILSVANTSLLNGTKFLEDSIDLVDAQIEEFGLNRRAVVGKKAEKMLSEIKKVRDAQGGSLLSEDQQISINRRAGESQPTQSFKTSGGITVEVLPD